MGYSNVQYYLLPSLILMCLLYSMLCTLLFWIEYLCIPLFVKYVHYIYSVSYVYITTDYCFWLGICEICSLLKLMLTVYSIAFSLSLRYLSTAISILLIGLKIIETWLSIAWFRYVKVQCKWTIRFNYEKHKIFVLYL